MGKLYVSDIINNLVKYKEIINIVDRAKLEIQLKEIDETISTLKPLSNICIEDLKNLNKKKESGNKREANKKINYDEVLELVINKKYRLIKGVKLDYSKLSNADEVKAFVISRSKEQLLKAATLTDLNILYFLVSSDKKEIKKKKEDLYNILTSYIKSSKQGEVFSRLTITNI